ncbi:MAG: hypothetical protein V7606_3944, partial [Burkholderiales bacterium]
MAALRALRSTAFDLTPPLNPLTIRSERNTTQLLDFSFPKGVTLQNPPLSRFASLAVLMTGLGASAHAFAAPCDETFSSSGNFFTGTVYKTWAELPGIKPDNAYKGAYLYTAKDGWKILQADKDLRII